MKHMPAIGSRVSYQSRIHDDRKLTGTVTEHFPSYPAKDENGKRYIIEASACIRVDTLPKWWPYNDNLFAPDISELTPSK